MSEERSPFGAFPPELMLDAQPGPAPYITRAKADAMIARALDEAGFARDDAPHGPERPALASAMPAHEQAGRAPRARAPVPPPPPPSARRSAPPARTREDRGEPQGSAGELPGASSEARRSAHGAASTPARRRRRLGVRSLAAAALVACVGIGSASAAVRWYVRERQPVTAIVEPLREPAAVPRRKPVRVPQAVAIPPELAPERDRPERRAPEDWLIEGNRLRAERRWAKADEAYTRAFESAPDSQTAYVARVASAAVRLEHLHDPRGALARYKTALRQTPRGALGEEIQFGISEAYRALGQRADERGALERFLRDYPSSPLATQARARLE